MTDPTHPKQSIQERLNRILVKLENTVATDMQRRMLTHSSGRSPKSSHYEAESALLDLFLDAVTEAKPEQWNPEGNSPLSMFNQGRNSAYDEYETALRNVIKGESQ